MHCYGDSALRGGFKNMVIAGRSLELLCLDVFFVLAALSFIFCQISFGGFHFPLSSLFPSLSVLWICLSLKPQSVPFLCHFSLSSQPCTHPSSASRDFFSSHFLLIPSLSLPVSDGSLYSAMSVAGGQSGSIRRTFGPQKLLKTENVWLLSE